MTCGMTDHEDAFKIASALHVPARKLTRVNLASSGESSVIRVVDDTLKFKVAGWFEVLLTVQWDSTNRDGRRFSHTAIPDSHPLHSEAIEADVLAELSDGRQLLRGN